LLSSYAIREHWPEFQARLASQPAVMGKVLDIVYLTAEGMDAMERSITYRIAVGPQQERKVFALQTLPDCRPDNPRAHTVGKVADFSGRFFSFGERKFTQIVLLLRGKRHG